MRKKLSDEQKKEVIHFENTYPNSVLMRPKDMAILSAHTKFPNTNRPRHNKMLADRAEEVFRELAFLLEHLPRSYKNKILVSNNFTNFVETLLDLETNTTNLNDKEKSIAVRIASQFFVSSLGLVKSSLPQEFKIPFRDSALPFLSWLKAISDYGQRNSLEDIPSIRISNKLMSPFS